MKTMKKRAMFAVAAALLTAVTVYSHDYWFEPETFFASAGGGAHVRLYVGEGLKSEEERLLQKGRAFGPPIHSASSRSFAGSRRREKTGYAHSCYR